MKFDLCTEENDRRRVPARRGVLRVEYDVRRTIRARQNEISPRRLPICAVHCGDDRRAERRRTAYTMSRRRARYNALQGAGNARERGKEHYPHWSRYSAQGALALALADPRPSLRTSGCTKCLRRAYV